MFAGVPTFVNCLTDEDYNLTRSYVTNSEESASIYVDDYYLGQVNDCKNSTEVQDLLLKSPIFAEKVKANMKPWGEKTFMIIHVNAKTYKDSREIEMLVPIMYK